jgi:uncharacterized protein
MSHRLTAETIDDEHALRALLGEPAPLVRAKVSDRILNTTRAFIELSPFVVLATSDEQGTCDVSPRGDPAGFVRILDVQTLLVPERPGNKLADSCCNIIRNPRIGLLFVVPGVTDTLRVNGRATLTTDVKLLSLCMIHNTVPKLGILVDIEQAFTHCAKAFLRSELWNPERFVSCEALPSNGAVYKELADGEFDAASYDEARAARYARREGFY